MAENEEKETEEGSMKVWVCTNANGEIIGISEASMSGNTGWEETTNTKLGQNVQGGYAALKSLLSTPEGVPLYLLAEGKAVARTQEAVAADAPAPESAPSVEQQIAALQEENAAALTAIAEVYEMLAAGGE
jgi:hypothetical protein